MIIVFIIALLQLPYSLNFPVNEPLQHQHKQQQQQQHNIVADDDAHPFKKLDDDK